MNSEKAKAVLSDMTRQAVAADNRGDVVMRDEKLRNIEDLPLPAKSVRAALAEHGLLPLHRGARN